MIRLPTTGLLVALLAVFFGGTVSQANAASSAPFGAAASTSLSASLEDCSSPISINAPATDLGQVVAAQPAGSCFFLTPGTYLFHDVVPKSGMIFVGESTASVIVEGTGHENAFHGTAGSVTIARMTFQNFNDSAGTTRQEQAPIRGTSRLWATNRGEMAVGWLIADIVSKNNYASGLLLGDDFHVVDSEFHNNGVTGIAGDEIRGGLIERNNIHHNGAQQAAGAQVNGGGVKLTQAGTPTRPVTLANNEIHHNTSIGVWCDVGCDGFHVLDNSIHDHLSRGIMFELSSTMTARGNLIVNSNSWTGYRTDFSAGAITVGESRNVLIENNRIINAESGVLIRQTQRPATGEQFLNNYDYVNYTVANVVVRNNRFETTRSMGISTGAGGGYPVADADSVLFAGNSYESAGSMRFWWNYGPDQSFSQWQAAGRDMEPSSDPVSTPTPTPTTQPATTSPPANQPPSSQPPASQPPTNQPPARQPAPKSPAKLPLRINSGGQQFIAPNGTVWQADLYFIDGRTASHAQNTDIQETSLDELYQDERWGASNYRIPVADGTYRVVLHHAEVFSGCQKDDCRRFSVTIEGQRVVRDLDLYDTVGGFTALTIETRHAVTDGELNIVLSSSKQEAQIAGIEVFAVAQPSISDESSGPPTVKPASPSSDKDEFNTSDADESDVGGQPIASFGPETDAQEPSTDSEGSREVTPYQDEAQAEAISTIRSPDSQPPVSLSFVETTSGGGPSKPLLVSIAVIILCFSTAVSTRLKT